MEEHDALTNNSENHFVRKEPLINEQTLQDDTTLEDTDYKNVHDIKFEIEYDTDFSHSSGDKTNIVVTENGIKTEINDSNSELDDANNHLVPIFTKKNIVQKKRRITEDNKSSGYEKLSTSKVKKTQRFDALTRAKLELVQLKKELVKAEIVEKQKEWDFKETERKWIEEEYRLKLQKLRRELKK